MKNWPLCCKLQENFYSVMVLTLGCHLSYWSLKFFPIVSSAFWGAIENGSANKEIEEHQKCHGSNRRDKLHLVRLHLSSVCLSALQTQFTFCESEQSIIYNNKEWI